MKNLLALFTAAVLFSFAQSSLTISNIVLANYGKESLVDSIAVSGELFIGEKARLPKGSINFRCTAVEFEPKPLPEAPEQVNNTFL